MGGGGRNRKRNRKLKEIPRELRLQTEFPSLLQLQSVLRISHQHGTFGLSLTELHVDLVLCSSNNNKRWFGRKQTVALLLDAKVKTTAGTGAASSSIEQNLSAVCTSLSSQLRMLSQCLPTTLECRFTPMNKRFRATDTIYTTFAVLSLPTLILFLAKG